MGDKNFIKDSGAFIVAFLLGSVTLHGMLYYLITDANDLFSSNNSLLPLLLFIAIYAAFPFGALAVWRHFFVSDKIFRPFQKKDEDKYILIDENVKLLKRFEKIIAITLGISLVFFVLYLILWLLFGKEFEVFYTMAVLGSIISLLAIVPVLFILKKIKLAEGADTITNTTNDAEAIEIRKSFNLEFIIGTAGWFILVAYIISAFWSHTNFEGITNWNLGEGKDAKFKPNKSVQSTLATEKRILNHINDGLGNIDRIENAFLLANFTGDSTIDFKGAFTNIDTLFLASYNSILNLRSDKNFVIVKDTCAINLGGVNAANPLDTVLAKHNHNICVLYHQKCTASETAFNDLASKIEGAQLDRNSIRDFNFWLSLSRNKLLSLKKGHQEALVDSLKPVLIKAQNYFLVFFSVMLFFTLLYWLASNISYVFILHLDNTDEKPEPLKEIEVSKAFIVLLFVFIVPILKPIESQNIEFNKPLWTANNITVQNLVNPVNTDLPQGNTYTTEHNMVKVSGPLIENYNKPITSESTPDSVLPSDDALLRQIVDTQKELNTSVAKTTKSLSDLVQIIDAMKRDLEVLEDEVKSIDKEVKNAKRR